MKVRPQRLLVAAGVLTLAAAFLTSSPARACSCIAPPPPLEALNQADAVFAGTVVEARRVEGGRDHYGYLRAEIAVTQRWKGEGGDRVVVRTPPNSAACGVSFEKGRTFIVYASLDEDGRLHTHLCTRTAQLRFAQTDLAELGEGEGVESSGGGLCGSNPAAVQTLFLVLLGLGFGRRGRRRR